MESKSLERFKSALVKEIPFFPNNKETKDDLMNQSISSVMFHYMHWATRFVPIRPRKVLKENYAIDDRRWANLINEINEIIFKVEAGEDLTPYLSLRVHGKGYTPADRIQNGDADQWDDKDLLLNVMGFYHFHLGPGFRSDGNVERSDEVIFARVTREEFVIVAISNHDVFDSEKDDSSEMNAERTRLWDIFNEYTSRGLPQGAVYVPSMVTMSGHPLHVRLANIQYTHVLNELDSKLDDKEFILSIYEETGISIPKNNKLNWHFNGLDLGWLDKTDNFFVFKYGPM